MTEEASVIAEDAAVEEDGTGTSGHRLQSSHSSGMESSIFRFKNVNFIVGTKDKQKNILCDVSGTVKWGHVLAVMGPSGAGKARIFILHDASLKVRCVARSLN